MLSVDGSMTIRENTTKENLRSEAKGNKFSTSVHATF